MPSTSTPPPRLAWLTRAEERERPILSTRRGDDAQRTGYSVGPGYEANGPMGVRPEGGGGRFPAAGARGQAVRSKRSDKAPRPRSTLPRQTRTVSCRAWSSGTPGIPERCPSGRASRISVRTRRTRIRKSAWKGPGLAGIVIRLAAPAGSGTRTFTLRRCRSYLWRGLVRMGACCDTREAARRGVARGGTAAARSRRRATSARAATKSGCFCTASGSRRTCSRP
jgi:hypothetical protein